MTEVKNTFIRISSGRLVDLMNPVPEDIELWSISRSLNAIRRFTGHYNTLPPMTVAQHSLLCMEIAARLYPGDVETELDCLIHDMPEAYYNDISSPMKRCIELKSFVDPIDKVLYDTLWKLDTPYNDEIKAKRKHCDLIALHIERNMMWHDVTEGNDDPRYFPQTEMPFDKKTQTEMFMFISLIPDVNLEQMYHSFFLEQENDKLINNSILVTESESV